MTPVLDGGGNFPVIMHPSGGTGTVRARLRTGVTRLAKSSTPVPVPSSPTDKNALVARLAQPYLELVAKPGAVPVARHHARQLLWDYGLKELIEPVELVVSEIVTNAVRASGGLEPDESPSTAALPIVRLWLSVESRGVLVLVWDANSSRPERQELPPDTENGRGLLLVDMLSAAWGSFEITDHPGKVVWALLPVLNIPSAGTFQRNRAGAAGKPDAGLPSYLFADDAFADSLSAAVRSRCHHPRPTGQPRTRVDS